MDKSPETPSDSQAAMTENSSWETSSSMDDVSYLDGAPEQLVDEEELLVDADFYDYPNLL